jgi:hypothetical protein
MRFILSVVVSCSILLLASTLPAHVMRAWAQAASEVTPAPPGQPATPATPAPKSPQGFWDAARAHPGSLISAAVLAGIIIVGGGILLGLAVRAGADPMIQRLGPSFFFWLSMMYMGLLLVMAGVYIFYSRDLKPHLLGGILPLGVPWFGALGAVTISLEGVFLWNSHWDRKYNYWHIARPLFGAVLGIVAFFLFVVIGAAAGTAPKFLDSTPPESVPLKDFIIFYVVAFLVGYREETFRDLIKRATDLILKPGTPAPAAPGVTFRIAGGPQQEIQCDPTAAGQQTVKTVEVQNSGTAVLTAPTATLVPIAPTPAGVFAIPNDRDLVTGHGDLAVGQVRTVDVRFVPAAEGGPDFTATLAVTATNLSEPKTILVRGRRA